jgi:hypothetical protein
MMPFTRQTFYLCMTICESSGCKDQSSSLTDSILALSSVDNCTEAASLVPLSAPPKIARESPAFAIYNNSPLHMTTTKQHDPKDAIWGLRSH